MSRKNNKKNRKKRHQQALEKEKIVSDRIKKRIEEQKLKAIEERKEAQEMADENHTRKRKDSEDGGMDVESGTGLQKRIGKKKKMRKFKIFQRRLLIEAKKRRKALRKAPLIRKKGGMEFD